MEALSWIRRRMVYKYVPMRTLDAGYPDCFHYSDVVMMVSKVDCSDNDD
jgi:hypothetical protein